MRLDQFYGEYLTEEQKYWEYQGEVRHNPVRYPRVGELFLREFFQSANPGVELPGERRKKVRMDTVWYSAGPETLMLFFLGTYLKKQSGDRLEIQSMSGAGYPFVYLWYLLCLYHDQGWLMAEKEIKEDYLRRFRKAKATAGLCRHDSRKYYQQILPQITSMAPNFPISAVCCFIRPEEMRGHTFEEAEWRKECCLENCKRPLLFVDGITVSKGMADYRVKEEFLYGTMQQSQRPEHGVTGADLMFQNLAGEYQTFYKKAADYARSQNCECFEKRFQCDLFQVFAYMADCLSCHNMAPIEEEKREEYRKTGLWQLAEAQIGRVEYAKNPLLFILSLADAMNPMREIKCDREILRGIDLSYNHADRRVHVNIDRTLAQTEPVQKYRTALQAVENRICVNVQIDIT